eukprot:3760111-Pleurochrysis_carterae.AAC.2
MARTPAKSPAKYRSKHTSTVCAKGVVSTGTGTVRPDSRWRMKSILSASSICAPYLSSLKRTPSAIRCNAKHDCESSCGFFSTHATN